MKAPKCLGRFEVPVYKHQIFVFEGMPAGLPANVHGRCEINPESLYIRLYFKTRKVHSGIIIHEIVHASDFILFNIGANLDTNQNTSEIRAYLTEYIWSKAGAILKRK